MIKRTRLQFFIGVIFSISSPYIFAQETNNEAPNIQSQVLEYKQPRGDTLNSSLPKRPEVPHIQTQVLEYNQLGGDTLNSSLPKRSESSNIQPQVPGYGDTLNSSSPKRSEASNTQPQVIEYSDTLNSSSPKKTTTLGEVVINTALGFKRTAKSLSYSAQEIKPDQLTTVKDANFTNAITGKASNVTITQGSGGVGSATNIILRGNNSITGNGAPLIVIDGIPTVNFNQRPNTGTAQYGGNYLAPDGLSIINSDDIEGLTILKGPAAAALYGSQAANGAILITTKKGKEGRARVNVSSNTTFSTAAYTPKLQTKYGSDATGLQSWGPKNPDASNAKNFYKDLLQTGVNTVNSVNFSAGNKMGQVFTSYANTYGKGLIPNNTLTRHNFDLKGDANFFNGLLEVGAKVSYTQQVVQNPYNPGSTLNPYFTLLTLPSNTDLRYYQKNYETIKAGEPTPIWLGPSSIFGDNPYWVINRVLLTDNLSRILVTPNIKVNFTDWLNFMVRGTLDLTNQQFIGKFYQGTNTTDVGTNGSYNNTTTKAVQYYGDAILNFNKDVIKDVFHINSFVGASIRDYTLSGTNISSKFLYVPNVFFESNLDITKGINLSPSYDRKQIQSLFYSVELSYKDALFLTNTGRNDWSSTLNGNSYFYPSIGASAVLTELIKSIKSSTLSYLKLRLDYTIVGNDLPTYIVNPTYGIGSTITSPTTVVLPGTVLKPEFTNSIEAGLDFALFNNFVKFEGTYYKTNTTNQLFTIAAPGGSGYSSYYVNAGNIQNQGVELSLTLSPKFGPLEWSSTINFSKNVNKVISLHERIKSITYSTLNNSSSYKQTIVPGGSLGDFYVSDWERNPDGSIKVQYQYINGEPVPISLAIQKEATQKEHSNPDFLLSWGNSFSYKGIRLSFLIDGRFGGKIVSLTQRTLDVTGNSIASAVDRDRGYIDIGGGQTYPFSNSGVDAYTAIKSIYQLKAGAQGPLSEYLYSATVIRLREISLAYSFAALLQKTKAFKYIQDISISFIARNLFYFYKPAPIDPEIVSNNKQGNYAFLGVEIYNLPATRNFGFGINFTF